MILILQFKTYKYLIGFCRVKFFQSGGAKKYNFFILMAELTDFFPTDLGKKKTFLVASTDCLSICQTYAFDSKQGQTRLTKVINMQ